MFRLDKHMNRKEKKYWYFQIIISTIIICVTGGYHIYAEKLPFLGDEIGYLSSAAYFSGHDWSGVISTIPYYGYGYGILLTPLFLIFKDPVLLYSAVLTLNIILLVLSFFIVIRCGCYFLKGSSLTVITFIALLITLYSNNLVQVHFAWSETVLYFLYWLSVLLIIKVTEKPSAKNLIILIMCLFYMFAVHMRALGVVLAGLLIIIWRVSMEGNSKEKLIRWGLICVLGAGAALLVLGGKEYITQHLWENSQQISGNDFSGQTEKIGAIFSVQGFFYLLKGMGGKVFYLGIATLTLGITGLWTAFSTAFFNVFHINKAGMRKNLKKGMVYAYLFMSYFFSLGITVVSMLYPTRVDTVIYGRYLDILIGPLLLLGIAFLLEKAELPILQNFFVCALILNILSFIVKDVFMEVSSGHRVIQCIAGVAYFFIGEYKLEDTSFVMCMTVLLILSVFALILFLGKRNKRFALFLGSGICIFFWMFNGKKLMDETLPRQNKVYDEYSYAAENIEKIPDLKKIYFVMDENEENKNSEALYLQYLLMEYPVEYISIKRLNEAEKNNTVFLVLNEGSSYTDCSNMFDIYYTDDKCTLFLDEPNQP